VPFSRIPPTQGIAGLRWRDEERTSYFDVYTWLVDRQDRYNPTNLSDSRFWVTARRPPRLRHSTSAAALPSAVRPAPREPGAGEHHQPVLPRPGQRR
jgi:hypothetical protein